jgi:hypothetical protein
MLRIRRRAISDNMTIKEFDVPEPLKKVGITNMKLLDDKKIGRYVKATYKNLPITATFNAEDISGTMRRFKNEAGEYIKDKPTLTFLTVTMTKEVENYIEHLIMDKANNVGGADGGGQEPKDAIVMKYTAMSELMDKQQTNDKNESGGEEEEEASTDNDDDDEISAALPAVAQLWESVRIAGSYYLVSYDSIHKKVKFTNGIKEKSGRNILPYSDSGGIDPYVFTDKADLEQYIELAKKENLGTLFRKVQACVKLFYDTDNIAYINLVAADVVFSYFQDRLGKTHYLFIYGDPGTGKGAVLDTMTQLAYRAADVTSITGPVLYRIMGSVERGQVVMIIDEANKLEDDELLLNVLKVGYKGKQRVPRIIDNERNIVEWFYAYCFKVVAAEKLPAHWKTGGFLSRCLIIRSAPGDPKIDIGDVLEHENDPKNMKVLRHLEHLRKLLFAYRLIHYNEPIPDIRIPGVRGRDRELIKPLLRLFKKHGEATSLEMVKDALYYFVRERNKFVIENFNAAMHTLIKDIIKNNRGNPEIIRSEIWDTIRTELKGSDVDGKPGTIYTNLYGEISSKKLAAVLHGLGGIPGQNSTGDSRVWVFDKKTLERFNSVYAKVPDKLEIEDMTEQTTLTGTSNDGRTYMYRDIDELLAMEEMKIVDTTTTTTKESEGSVQVTDGSDASDASGGRV